MKKQLHIVVGLGKSGMSVVRFLAQQGIPFAVADTRETPPEIDVLKREYPGVATSFGELCLEFLQQASRLFVAPGLSIQHPVLQQAKALGIEISGDIDLFAQYVTAPVIAITGSNAKSTVTTLVANMAKRAGLNVAVGGNLGQPALELLDDAVELYVLELSSFQLETTRYLKPVVATCLNISEDHTDRYPEGMASYIAAKQRVFLGAEQAVVNRDDRQTYPKDTAIPVSYGFTTQAPKSNDFGLVQTKSGYCLAYGADLLLAADQLKLKGMHNYSNVLAALALGKAAGLPLTAMLEAAVEFVGLAHRCQWVAEYQQVTWYNDSKGTNVGATLAALEGFSSESTARKIILIAGGDGKGADFSSLTAPIHDQCRAVILLGRDARQLGNIVPASVKTLYVNSVSEAVTLAKQEACVGDLVLFSPACASLDMFKSFEHRGEVFVQAVKGLIQ